MTQSLFTDAPIAAVEALRLADRLRERPWPEREEAQDALVHLADYVLSLAEQRSDERAMAEQSVAKLRHLHEKWEEIIEEEVEGEPLIENILCEARCLGEAKCPKSECRAAGCVMERSSATALWRFIRGWKCRRDGHIRPSERWYASSYMRAEQDYRCLRCGTPVEPVTDWSGHP